MDRNHHQAAWAARVATLRDLADAVGIRAAASDDAAQEVEDLQAHQSRLLARSQALLDQAQREGRELTEDERHGVTRRTAEIERLQGRIDALSEELSRPRPRALSRSAGDAPGTVPTISAAGAPAASGTSFDRTDARFSSLFARAADPYGARFASLTDFCRAVASGRPDSRLMAATMTESDGAGGGFMVPTQFLGAMLDSALSQEVVRPYANVVPLTTRSGTVGIFDGADGTNSARAGLRLLWGAEAAALTEQKGKVRELTLATNKGHVFVRTSTELLEDGVNFDRQLAMAMRDAVAAGMDFAFINGTGAGQPLGILGSGALITVSKESGQTGATLRLENLAAMAGRLAPASFRSARWVVHPTVVPALYRLSFTVANLAGSDIVGGSHVQAVTQDADGTMRIFGRPVDISDAGAPLGTVGDVLLCDWTRYVIGLRRDATIERDASRYFDSDEIAFRLTLRAAGQPVDAAPMKLRDGTNTVGPFVALETR